MKEKARDIPACDKRLMCEKIWSKSTKVEYNDLHKVEFKMFERTSVFRFLQCDRKAVNASHIILKFKGITWPLAAHDIQFNYTSAK